MSKKNYFKQHNVVTDTDVRVRWQYVPTTITSSEGTHEADDILCITLTDLDRKSLAAFFTVEQIEKFIVQLTQAKNELQRRYDEKRGIKTPF